MEFKNQLRILALCTWIGMVIFPILGIAITSAELPDIQTECPQSVWNQIDQGTLSLNDVTKSDSTMKNYNCNFLYPEEEPFNPTNWLLFGIVTGFMVGTFFLRDPIPAIVRMAHHGESKECYKCHYSHEGTEGCNCPECRDQGSHLGQRETG